MTKTFFLSGVLLPIGIFPSRGIVLYQCEGSPTLYVADLNARGIIVDFLPFSSDRGQLILEIENSQRVRGVGDSGIYSYANADGELEVFNSFSTFSDSLKLSCVNGSFLDSPFFELDISYQFNIFDNEISSALRCLSYLYAMSPEVARVWVEQGVMNEAVREAVRIKLMEYLSLDNFEGIPKLTRETTVWVSDDLLQYSRVQLDEHENVIPVNIEEISKIGLKPRVLFVSGSTLSKAIMQNTSKRRLDRAVSMGLLIIHVEPHERGMKASKPVIVSNRSKNGISVLNVSVSSNNFVDFLEHYLHE